MVGLVFFAVGILGTINYNKSTRILKLQAEQLLRSSLAMSIPTDEKLSRETVNSRLNILSKAHGVVPFVLADGGIDSSYPAPPHYASLLNALATNNETQVKLLRGDDLIVEQKIGTGTIRVGLIYPYKNLLPLLAEVRNKAILFCGITVIIAISLSFLASRDISRPIEIMKNEAIRFTGGDYTWKDDFFSDDESADLALGFRAMSNEIVRQMERVRSLIENIELTAHHLGTSASELETIAREQAAGSAEQAAAIQQALTTAGEIAATARQISENSLTVNNVSAESRDACDNSKKIVSITIGGIEEVRDHVNAVARGTLDLAQLSQQIQGIVDIIEEINEQTHLLSVNASIEASGAGEEGKRFAVLAREIRRLAEGTVEATEQIKGLVEQIQKFTTSTVMMAEESTKVVASWAGQVDKLGEAFSTISALVELASNATGEIRTSTQQQTTACEQMAQVIAEVKEVADQVVTSSKETERSMADLSELTTKLKEIITKKQVNGDQAEC
jgi:methyl-accepting chemotaxis protein